MCTILQSIITLPLLLSKECRLRLQVTVVTKSRRPSRRLHKLLNCCWRLGEVLFKILCIKNVYGQSSGTLSTYLCPPTSMSWESFKRRHLVTPIKDLGLLWLRGLGVLRHLKGLQRKLVWFRGTGTTWFYRPFLNQGPIGVRGLLDLSKGPRPEPLRYPDFLSSGFQNNKHLYKKKRCEKTWRVMSSLTGVYR